MSKIKNRQFLDDLITHNIVVKMEGFRNMVKSLEKAEQFYVEVGVVGRQPKKLKEIAEYQEYGTFREGKRHIPPRSFLRWTFKQYGKDAVEMIKKLIFERIIDDHTGEIFVASKYGIRKAFGEVGSYLKSAMQFRIATHIPPKLKKSTIAQKRRKGYSLPTTPLIARGDLFEAIDYRVHEKKAEKA